MTRVLVLIFSFISMSFNKKTLIPRFCKLSLLMVFLLSANLLSAQESADKIIGVVGRNRIILQSDLEMQSLRLDQL